MNKDLSSLKDTIGHYLRSTDAGVCLWFSGGRDSRLLLEVMLEQDEPFGILRFDDGWPREYRRAIDKLIIEKNIPVLSYPPRFKVLIGDGGENLSVVCGYSIDEAGSMVFLVRDLVDDGPCSFDIDIPLAPQIAAPVEYKIHIWGSRREDEHYAVPELVRSSEWRVGAKLFAAPLFDWSRKEINEALDLYGISDFPNFDTGDIPACTRCLKGSGPAFCPKADAMIESVDWQPEENLRQLKIAIGERQ